MIVINQKLIYYLLVYSLLFHLFGCDNNVAAQSTHNTVKTDEQISLENWFNHPEIKKIRKIYSNIKSGIAEGTIIETKKVFDLKDKDCNRPSTERKSIAFDKNNKLRMFSSNIFTSRETVGRVEYYFDDSENLRFIYVNHSIFDDPADREEDRIYLDAKSKVIIAVQKINEEYNKIKYFRNSAVGGYITSDQARRIFNAHNPCREINE